MNGKKKFFCILEMIMIVLVLFSVHQTQAVLIWTENFNTEDPAGWSFRNWIRPGMIHFTSNSDPGMRVVNEILRAPNSTDFETAADALYNNSVAYGSWSFDWLVVNGSDHLAYDAVAFMFTDTRNSYNMTGLTEAEYLMNCNGYSLLLISSSKTAGIAGAAIPGISLASYTPSYTILSTHEFANDIVGIHHINISRNLQGEFSVYFDSELVIEATDNGTTTSERFLIVSFKGDSGFDNISVKDLTIDETITTTTTTTTTTDILTTATTSNSSEGFLGWLLLPIMMTLIIKRKLSKKVSE